MNPTIQLKPQTKLQIAYSVYAALDLHCGHSLLGGMDHDGNWLGQSRFVTDSEHLTAAVRGLGGPGAGVCLTLEASSLTRWAAGLVRPLVDRLVICEPRHNRLVNANPTKKDEEDVNNMCLLLRVNKLQEVWMGEDRGRQIHRELVYELLNWRDAQRELKALIKARYRQWGVLRVEGTGVFSRTQREDYLAQLPGEEERRMLLRVYEQHDHAMGQWKSTLREVRRAGREFWEAAEFQKIPGIGVVGAHVFSAIIEDPARFETRQKLMSYARLSITDRSSDGKPLGYQRLDRRGHRELKTLSYHAWRTACKSTTHDNAVQRFHRASLGRTHDVRHARLNCLCSAKTCIWARPRRPRNERRRCRATQSQRKLLTAMWCMWLRREAWDPERFFPTTDPKAKAGGRSETEDAGG